MEQITDETKALQSETASSSFYPHPITVDSNGTMLDNNLSELWGLIDEMDITPAMEPNSNMLLSDLDLQDDLFPAHEGNVRVPCPDHLDSGENAKDMEEYWNVFDELSPIQTTSTPSSKPSHTKSDLECSSEPHPSSTPLASCPSKSIQSLSPPESVVKSPQEKCPKINIIFQPGKKRNCNRKLKNNPDPQSKQPDAQSERTSSSHSPFHFVGWLNGQQLYKMRSPSSSSCSTDSEEANQEGYVKKPLNAFMLFMREQRPNISKELWRKGSGTVNSQLAAMWRSMSKGEKSTYFKMAEELRQTHKLNNPSWSHHLNYGKKRPRSRRKDCIFPLHPKPEYVTVNPGQPMQIIPTLPIHFPQQPYMWNPPQQGPFIQPPFPQGSGTFFHPQMGWMQNPQPPVVTIVNQGDWIQNPELQLHVPHAPLAPHIITCPPQGYMGAPDEGVCTQNPPQELGLQNPAVEPSPQDFLEKQ